jgi:excisionase family DNA binding protein
MQNAAEERPDSLVPRVVHRFVEPVKKLTTILLSCIFARFIYTKSFMYRHIYESTAVITFGQGKLCLYVGGELRKGDYLENLISVEEAAKRLGGISKWTVHAWLSQGRLRRTKVGSRTMIRESELQKVIQEGGKSVVHRRIEERRR